MGNFSAFSLFGWSINDAKNKSTTDIVNSISNFLIYSMFI